MAKVEHQQIDAMTRAGHWGGPNTLQEAPAAFHSRLMRPGMVHTKDTALPWLHRQLSHGTNGSKVDKVSLCHSVWAPGDSSIVYLLLLVIADTNDERRTPTDPD